MKKVSIVSILGSLIQFSLPEGSSGKGLYLRFVYENTFTHIMLLSSPGPTISVLTNNNSKALRNNWPIDLPMTVIASTDDGAELLKQLMEADFFPGHDSMDLDLIREVTCNSHVLPETLNLGVEVSVSISPHHCEIIS